MDRILVASVLPSPLHRRLDGACMHSWWSLWMRQPRPLHRERDVSDIVAIGAEAMRAKRRELINQPLERIWPELMQEALRTVREPFAAIADRHSFEAAQAIRRAVLRATLPRE